MARFIRKLCSKKLDSATLEALLACCFISLDKNPGVRLIGVGEILRQIAGKALVVTNSNDVIANTGTCKYGLDMMLAVKH